MTLELGERRILHPGPLRWLRALAWMIALGVGLAFLQYGVAAGLQALGAPSRGWPGLGVTAVGCLVALGAYAGLVWAGEGRAPSEIAPRAAPLGLVTGWLIGFAMFCAVMAILVFGGLYDIAGPRPADPMNAAIMALDSGVSEELLIRAVVLRLLARAFGPWWALGLSAALFGALHLMNPNASAVAAIAIAMEAGLMLGAFYLLTGNLWVPIGIHAAWNFTQAFVFGAAVSGFSTAQSLWETRPAPGKPEILTGGAFGPEASIPAMAVGTGLAVAALWLAWKRGAFAKPAPEGPRDLFA